MASSLLLLLLLLSPAAGFLDQILKQMQDQQMGGQRQANKPQFPGWPKDVRPNIGKKFDWMRNTRWNWNDWSNVQFEADGNFHAPTEDCEYGACKWAANRGKIYIMWGSAGLHTLKASQLSGEKGTTLEGERNSDGDPVVAKFVKNIMQEETSAAKRKQREEQEKQRQKQQQQQQQRLSGGDEDDEDEDEVDLYAELGLDSEASPRAIKKAFRKLSVKYHPDKNPGDEEAAKKFKTIANAHEVLGDPDKKILYDTGGMKMVEEAAKEDAGGGQQDPFSMLFGGGRRNKGSKAKKGQDYRMEMGVTLEKMYNGGEISLQIRRRVVCRGCRKRKVKGKDGKKTYKPLPKRCEECEACPHETKMVMKQMGPGMMVQQQERVPSKEKCKQEDTRLQTEIEKGMDEGSELKFERMSEQKPGEIPGDVIVKLKQKEHTRFKRKRNDLHTTLKITLKEALLGFKRTIDHLDGRKVTVERADRITSPFDVVKLGGEGMPVHETPSQFGDMFVELQVQIPIIEGDKKGRAGEGGVISEDLRQRLGEVLTEGFTVSAEDRARMKKEREEAQRKEAEEREREEKAERERELREAKEAMEAERKGVESVMHAQQDSIEGMRFDDDDDDGEEGEDEGEDDDE